MALNLVKRHPHADRPLVDWDLILVMEPLTMAGAVVGAFTSKVLPDWLLVISLVFLLAFTTYTTLEKGLQQFAKETKLHQESLKNQLNQALEKDAKMVEMEESKPLLSEEIESESEEIVIEKKKKSRKSKGKKAESVAIVEMSVKEPMAPPVEPVRLESPKVQDPNIYMSRLGEMTPELEELLESERETPREKVSLITIMIAAVIVINIVKIGKEPVNTSPV